MVEEKERWLICDKLLQFRCAQRCAHDEPGLVSQRRKRPMARIQIDAGKAIQPACGMTEVVLCVVVMKANTECRLVLRRQIVDELEKIIEISSIIGINRPRSTRVSACAVGNQKQRILRTSARRRGGDVDQRHCWSGDYMTIVCSPAPRKILV